MYMPISFHFMRKRPGVKESSIDRVKLDSSFCVLMSPWRWQQEKFIKWYSMHLSDLVRLNSTTTTKKFSLWKGHCWFCLHWEINIELAVYWIFSIWKKNYDEILIACDITVWGFFILFVGTFSYQELSSIWKLDRGNF